MVGTVGGAQYGSNMLRANERRASHGSSPLIDQSRRVQGVTSAPAATGGDPAQPDVPRSGTERVVSPKTCEHAVPSRARARQAEPATPRRASGDPAQQDASPSEARGSRLGQKGGSGEAALLGGRPDPPTGKLIRKGLNADLGQQRVLLGEEPVDAARDLTTFRNSPHDQ